MYGAHNCSCTGYKSFNVKLVSQNCAGNESVSLSKMSKIHW